MIWGYLFQETSIWLDQSCTQSCRNCGYRFGCPSDLNTCWPRIKFAALYAQNFSGIWELVKAGVPGCRYWITTGATDFDLQLQFGCVPNTPSLEAEARLFSKRNMGPGRSDKGMEHLCHDWNLKPEQPFILWANDPARSSSIFASPPWL